MVTVPARRSIFSAKRIFPYRDWKPNKEIGTSPGWLPIDDPQRTFTTALREAGYWSAQISDNPFTAFMNAYEPFRQTFHQWKTIVGQSGFRQARGRLDGDREPLAPAVPARRALRARHAQVPGEHRRGPRRGGDLRRPDLQGRRRHARRRAPPPAVRAHDRLLRPSRAVEPAAEVPRHVRRPGLRGAGGRRDRLRLRAELHPRADAPPARGLRGRGHDDRRLVRPLHGALPRAGARQEHRGRADERPRLPARRARLHRQGPLPAPPRAGAGAARDRAPGRPPRRRRARLLRLDPRHRPDDHVAGRRRRRAGWRAPTCP